MKLEPDCLWVIGAFDHPDLTPYPTHVRPILAKRRGDRFARVFSQIGSPRPYDKHSPLEFLNLKDILPYSNFIRCEPVKFEGGDQIIYLGNNKIISESKIFKIYLKVTPFVFLYRFRLAILTLLNCSYSLNN